MLHARVEVLVAKLAQRELRVVLFTPGRREEAPPRRTQSRLYLGCLSAASLLPLGCLPAASRLPLGCISRLLPLVPLPLLGQLAPLPLGEGEGGACVLLLGTVLLLLPLQALLAVADPLRDGAHLRARDGARSRWCEVEMVRE